MVNFMEKAKIIEFHNRGLSNRKIAVVLGINRMTVNKYVRQYKDAHKAIRQNPGNVENIRKFQEILASEPKYSSRKRTDRKYSKEIDSVLNRILEEEEIKRKTLGPNKQALTNKQIHELIVEEGYNISYSTISKKIKEKRKPKKNVFVAQQYKPGERFEYDFGEVKLVISNKLHKIQMAVFTLPYSHTRLALLYDNQKQQVFIESQVKFFEKIGGVPAEGVYDNMRNVVSKFIGKNEKQLNPKLLQLAMYYGFSINVTNCYAGNEKGCVERSVEIVRRSAFSKKIKFDTLEEAQEHLNNVLEKLNNPKKLAEEQKYLKQYSAPFECCEIRTMVKPDKYSSVMVDKCRYSVPEAYCDKSLTLKIYSKEIIVCSRGEIVATHKRASKGVEFCFELDHYLGTLTRKPGALKNSVALANKPKLKKIFDQYYKDNPKAFIKKLLNKEDLLQLANNSDNSYDFEFSLNNSEEINHVEEETLNQNLEALVTVQGAHYEHI